MNSQQWLWLAMLLLFAVVAVAEWQASARNQRATEELRAVGDDVQALRDDTAALLHHTGELLETCHALIAWMHEQWERQPAPDTVPAEAVITPEAVTQTPRRPSPRKRTAKVQP